MILIVVISGITKSDVSGGRWDIFFYIVGGLTTIIGAALLFIMPKEEVKVIENKENYFKNIFYGFRPSVIKNNKMLYLYLLTFGIFSIAIQVFFPYLIVYIQKTLEIVDMNFTITLGIVLIVSSIITVVIGLFMDKIGLNKILIPAISVALVGAVLFIFAKPMGFVIAAGIILISGYMVSTAIFGAKIRDYTPVNKAGLFQGIRMIFVVLLPMVTGPYIGEGLSHIKAITYTNDYGEEVIQPNKFIFLGAAIVIAISVVVAIFVLLREKKEIKEDVK
jgi:MFS family permease